MTPSTAEVRPKWLKMDKSSSRDSVIPSQEGNLKTTERWELGVGAGKSLGFSSLKGGQWRSPSRKVTQSGLYF